MNNTASVLAIAGALTFIGVGAAQAAPVSTPAYVSPENRGAVSDGTVFPGQILVFSSAQGIFTPGEIIDIIADRTAGNPSPAGFGPGGAGSARGGLIVLNQVVLNDTVTADAEGNFSYSVQLEEEGDYTLTATGRTSGETVTARVVVSSEYATAVSTGTTGGTTSGLADTGIDSAMLLWGAAGIGALGLGAGSIVVSRRRTGAQA